MKIGIDISQLAYHGTGVARYTENLVKAVLKYDKENEYVFLFSSLRANLSPEIEDLIKEKSVLKRYYIAPTILNILWNKIHIVPIEYFTGDIDVYISSDWCQAPAKKARKATIVHDLIVYRFPQTTTQATSFSFSGFTISPNIVETQKKRLFWVKKECDIIIADSYSTKKDIVNFLKIDENKIQVVYPAVEIKYPTQKEINSVLSKYNLLNTDYYLSVGKLEPRKNIPLLISAFIKADIKKTALVIAGTKGWGNDIKYDINKLGLTEKHNNSNIKFLGFVPDFDLYALYAGASLFIMPSIYEGFGYPLVEAMMLDCPVAASNTSSLKELLNVSEMLFDPNDEKQLIKILKKKTLPKAKIK